MELNLNGVDYSTSGKLDAFAQLHLARKLGPAIPIVDGLVSAANAEKDKSLLMVLMLSNISDPDVEFIMQKCLSVVMRRQSDGKMAKVQSSTGVMMFDDIPMKDLLALTISVIEENLGDFFRTALSGLEGKATLG